jgi:hypothetical protein
MVVGRTVALAPSLEWYREERRSASKRFLRVAERARLERSNDHRETPRRGTPEAKPTKRRLQTPAKSSVPRNHRRREEAGDGADVD